MQSITAKLALVAALSPSIALAQGELTFVERAQAAGLHAEHVIGNAVPPPGTDLTMTWILAGAAALDFDRDGYQDLFVLGGGGHRDTLYRNRGNGTFKRLNGWGLDAPDGPAHDVPHTGGGVAVGDFDGDGLLDMFVTSQGPANLPTCGLHRLLKNIGNGHFQDVAQEAGVNLTAPFLPDGTSAAFGDYDLDGDLDLFVAGWRTRPFSSISNRLFRNEGNGTFTDVTVQAGLNVGRIAGFTPAWVDMDGDRYPELLIAGDHKTSRYFINNGDGTFTDHTKPGGLGLDTSAMGATIGDLTNDGILDWVISEIYNPFGPAGSNGNKLYAGLGNHQYESISMQYDLHLGFWGWGIYMQDYDHNGLLDLLEVNGWPYQGFHADPDLLWLQLEPLQFVPSGEAAGIAYAEQGRGLVVFDYDNDGDLDYLTTRNDGPVRFFENQLVGSGPDRHWLRVFLDTSNAPGLAPDGFGARVVAEHGDQSWFRIIGNHASFLSWSEISAHFGLAAIFPTLDVLRVEWPDGTTTVMTDVPVDQTLTIHAP